MPNDLASLVPSSVVVCYPASADGILTTEETPITVALASLGLGEYAGIIGASWEKVLHRYEIAKWSAAVGSSTFLNETQLTALAHQIATDWYHWQLANLDIQYTSPVPWNPDGLEDLEWSQLGNVKTRLIRGPWNPPEDLLTAGPLVVNNSLVIENVYITNVFSVINFYNIVNFYSVVNFYETVIFIDGVIWGNPITFPVVTNVCYFPFTAQYIIPAGPVSIDLAGTDLVTATFTLSEPTTVIFFGYVDWIITGAGSATADLTVDGNVILPKMPVNFPITCELMGAQAWVVSLAAGNHTAVLGAIKLSGTVAAGVNTDLVIHADGVLVTQYQYLLLPNGTQFGGVYCTLNPKDCCPPYSGSPAPECALCSPLYPIARQWVINFTLVGCGGIGSSGPDCPCCADDTPSGWEFIGTGFSGIFSVFNGVSILGGMSVGGGNECVWVGGSAKPGAPPVGPGYSLVWECAGPIILSLDADGSGTGTAQYFPTVPTPVSQCCNPIVLPLQIASAPGAQASVTLTPIGCGGGNITGPITVTYVGGCCWYGVSDTNPEIAAEWCLEQNPDGTTSWLLVVLQGGVAIGVWRHNNGDQPVDCCAVVDDIVLQSTTCVSGSLASATPLGCESSGGTSGVVVTCCPQPIPFTLWVTFGTTPPNTAPACRDCFNGLLIPIVWTEGYYPFDPSNPTGDAWVGRFDCLGGTTTFTLQCLVSGVFVWSMTGKCDAGSGNALSESNCGPPLFLTLGVLGVSGGCNPTCCHGGVQFTITEI